MSDPSTLRDPWLVAVWPGMGNVAMGAGTYLVEQLEVSVLGSFPADRHFDIQAANIRQGLVLPGALPRNRFYGWRNPDPPGRDLVIFVGEAQPAVESYAFCNAMLRVARGFGVTRVISFAAMVTDSQPNEPSRVFTVATQAQLLEEVRRISGGGLTTLAGGTINGLNGTLLAACAADGREATGFLGEVPQIAMNLPYPKASLAVLELFCRVAGIELDLDPLAQQAASVEQGLVELMRRLGKLLPQELPGPAPHEGSDVPLGLDGEVPALPDPEDEHAPAEEVPRLVPETLAQIEALFLSAAGDRARALELKAALDEHGVFKEYEDRFLDLFRPRGDEGHA